MLFCTVWHFHYSHYFHHSSGICIVVNVAAVLCLQQLLQCPFRVAQMPVAQVVARLNFLSPMLQVHKVVKSSSCENSFLIHSKFFTFYLRVATIVSYFKYKYARRYKYTYICCVCVCDFQPKFEFLHSQLWILSALSASENFSRNSSQLLW